MGQQIQTTESFSVPVKDTYTEVNTGTDDAKFVTAAALQLSKLNIRKVSFGVLAPDVDQTASTSVQIGSTFRSRVKGTIVAVGCYDEVAGTTGTATYDIHLAGTTIMTSTKISIENGELSSLLATTQPVLTTTAITEDALLTFFCDAVQSGTAAKGLTFWMDVKETV